MEWSRTFWSVSGAVLAALVVAGCAQHTPCGSEELCNFEDDDCDGEIDEDFRDEAGLYPNVDNCGGCGVDCREVLPTAEVVDCVPMAGSYGCVADSCIEGHHLFEGACVPDVDVLCMACEDDEDCATFAPGARCLPTEGGSRCAPPCGTGCEPGFACEAGLCVPDSGVCACTSETEGVTFGCLLEAGAAACAGRQLCEGGELGPCEPAFEEICNAEDDDCDGSADEDFLDEVGGYVHEDHCGECNRPCAPQGPHVVATCVVSAAGTPECVEECEEDFVDLDGVAANGCECERTVGSWPPSRLGVDADCDGDIDDSDEFLFVAGWGADTNPGTLVFPMRTIAVAMERAAVVDKTVLVSGGVYHERIDMIAGVEVFGGYNADFSERDTAVYATVLQPHDGLHGIPAVTCHGISEPSAVGGMTIMGSDATAVGAGSTAVYLDGCTDAVRLVDLTVVAGRGADGAAGADSSTNLAAWGLTSLSQLAGRAGGDGAAGFTTSSAHCTTESRAGGAGGRQTCPGSATVVNGGDGAATTCVDSRCRVGSPCGLSGCTDFMVGGTCDMAAVLRAAVPNPPGTAGSGPTAGGGGEQTYHAPTNRGTCHFCDDNPTLRRVGANGGPGGSGSDGRGGTGCADSAGSFDATTGLWVARGGGGGLQGQDGSGGGGGSSGGGYEVMEGITEECSDALGGSGGGGGSGGCGAPQASGGGGGGGSIGVAIRLPTGASRGPELENVTVVAASAGAGGPGGIGAVGGAGGPGGVGGQSGGAVGDEGAWCTRRGGRGGDGGEGGAGGGGGGGCGGSVSGVHVLGSSSARGYVDDLSVGNSVEALPAGGRGGAGGFSPGSSGSAGADGSAVPFRLVSP